MVASPWLERTDARAAAVRLRSSTGIAAVLVNAYASVPVAVHVTDIN